MYLHFRFHRHYDHTKMKKTIGTLIRNGVDLVQQGSRLVILFVLYRYEVTLIACYNAQIYRVGIFIGHKF